MEIKKIKILLEDYISREPTNNYGSFTATTLNVNLFLTQEIKDMGMFIEQPFIPYNKNLPTLTYEPLPDKLAEYGGDFNFITDQGANFYTTGSQSDVRYRYKPINNYYTNNIIITGLTEDRLDNVTSYGFKGLDKFVPGFAVEKTTYMNYMGNLINGVTEVISINDYNPIIYTEDAKVNDPNIGTLIQSDGILFKTYSAQTRNVDNPLIGTTQIPLTIMSYQGQGVNEINSTLSALTIEEYLLHITQTPKVDSDLFIDRGSTAVLQNHLQLGEIVTLDQLVNYGNGYYNIT